MARFARSSEQGPSNEMLAAQARELFGLERMVTVAEVEAFLVRRYGARSLPLETLPTEEYVSDEHVEYPLVTSLWSIDDPAALQSIASDLDRETFYPYEVDPDDLEYPRRCRSWPSCTWPLGRGGVWS